MRLPTDWVVFGDGPESLVALREDRGLSEMFPGDAWGSAARERARQEMESRESMCRVQSAGEHRAVSRVQVRDLRAVCAGTLPRPRTISAGDIGVVLGPSCGRSAWRGLWGPSHTPGAGPHGGTAGAETTPEAVSGVYCRVCGDAEGGPWGMQRGLRVLCCEGCLDTLDWMCSVNHDVRLRMWSLIGRLEHGDLSRDVVEVTGVRHCWTCGLPVRGFAGAYGPREVCAACECIVRHICSLDDVRVELVKAGRKVISDGEKNL